MKRILTVLLVLSMLTAVCAGLAEMADVPSVTVDLLTIDRHGNLELDVKGSALLAAGFRYGDTVTVTIAGREFDALAGSNYFDVAQGAYVLKISALEDHDKASLAINGGDITAMLELAERDPENEGVWMFAADTEQPLSVRIVLKERGENVQALDFTRNREDYPHLNDEQYANFRVIVTTGMGQNALYRSASPIDDGINRGREAAAALESRGIGCIVNLADSAESMKQQSLYADSLYSRTPVIALTARIDILSDSMKETVVTAVRFMLENDGPYLVHCTEGKDRTGFVCMILESFMGAGCREVAEDYMTTYYNLYGVEPDTDRYNSILYNSFLVTLRRLFDEPGLSVKEEDLSPYARDYLISCGLTEEELESLKQKLGRDY